MKTAVIAYSDELNDAISLTAQLAPLQAETELWVLGDVDKIACEAIPVSRVFVLGFANPSAIKEPIVCAEAVYELFSAHTPELAVCCSGLRGDELAAQLAVLSDAACILGARSIVRTEDGFSVSKSVYAGNLAAEFFCGKLPLVISLRPNGESCLPPSVSPELIRLETDADLPSWLSEPQYTDIKREFSLSEAKLVVAAGRGVGKAQNYKTLEELAKKLGGVLGGSRPTVCDGKLPAHRLIGISGTALSAELCIAFGVSGSAGFMAGLEGVKKLVAVNRDADALIFDGCDYGVVADCNEFALALSELLD